jgi:7-cyano-7-deazaguanine synthase
VNQIIRSPASAVLLSGGLDSAVLAAEEATRGEVWPIYVRFGLAWEDLEQKIVRVLLESGALGPRVRPLATLDVDMRDVYPATHWARQGRPPAYDTPDEDVYLPGRNVVLLGKAGVFCAMAGIGRLLLGTLGHNPFPDATADFRSAMGAALSLGLDHALRIEAPYASVGKAEIVRRGAALGVPLERTLSCMNPTEGPRHCGQCSKCRERHDAFVTAGVEDRTDYADVSFVHQRRGHTRGAI